jgi:uncharacterized protein (DUF1697 family)
MQTFISILRGINVSGKHLIKMTDLLALYHSLGFKEVKSYIQSGNLVFRSESTNPELLENVIQKKMESSYSFLVPVIVLKVAELKKILQQNPFLKDAEKDPAFFHICFFHKKPDPEKLNVLRLHPYGSDQWFVKDRVMYLYCANGYGNTKLSNNFLEKKLQVNATTRNWKTSNKLLEMAEALQ